MKPPSCPKCIADSKICPKIRRCGSYYRTSDSKSVPRFQCQVCGKHFSRSTSDPYYRKRERRKSRKVKDLLDSLVSLRRAAKKLKINRKTVARMLVIEGALSKAEIEARNLERGPISVIEFDDLETFEHSKCKPLSITLAVESKSRIILGFTVSRMPARGPLAHFAREKYGITRDERRQGREELLHHLKLFAAEDALFKSDENPHYPASLKKIFPHALHKTYKGKRGAITGQGELKKVLFDPLFSLNHTCAMFRANVNRLIRKTWCTTKRIDRLVAHLYIYANYHNREITRAEDDALLSAAKGAS